MKRINKKLNIRELYSMTSSEFGKGTVSKADLEMMTTAISRVGNYTPIIVMGDFKEQTKNNNGLVNLKKSFDKINSSEIKKDEKN
jgi:hypothetical protein